jgi:hypothetical protein
VGHEQRYDLRWPFKQWGVDLVLQGHVHNYERLNVNGLPVVTTGAGGGGLHQNKTITAPESQFWYAANYGFNYGVVNDTDLILKFYSIDQTDPIDTLTIHKDCN